MTARRTLGPGPQPAHTIRAAQADLLETLPGVDLPDAAELRARGVLGARPTALPSARRILGAGGHPDEQLPN
ncbi:hypothetical protein [Streptomyces sp. NPDC056337]|uniref:hypothetical protein n=1 Tax=Streptomyces sp. NPDC056337 TaxID=3345787 RepID=UPI0035DBACCF